MHYRVSNGNIVHNWQGISSNETICWEFNWRLLIVAYFIWPHMKKSQMNECAQPANAKAQHFHWRYSRQLIFLHEFINQRTHLTLLLCLKFQLIICYNSSSFRESLRNVSNPILHNVNKETETGILRTSCNHLDVPFNVDEELSPPKWNRELGK